MREEWSGVWWNGAVFGKMELFGANLICTVTDFLWVKKKQSLTPLFGVSAASPSTVTTSARLPGAQRPR